MTTTKTEINQKVSQDSSEELSSDKYYKKFDFFYKRTCFRLMAEFYKQTFQPYQRLWIDQRRKTDLNQLINEYAEANFGRIIIHMKDWQRTEFTGMLSLVVLSHRHNKEESIHRSQSKKGDLDFSLVRDTMYKYSKKAQERFFRNAFLAFLFIGFATSHEGLRYIDEKFEDKGKEYLVRMHIEMDELRVEAQKTLKSAVKNDQTAKLLHPFTCF